MHHNSTQTHPPIRVDVFWSRVDVGGDDECWLWTGAHNQNGYGRFRANGTVALSHRVAYEIEYGPIPDGLVVRHACDTKACCNPQHLIVGTNHDNMRDAIDRGLLSAQKLKANWEMVDDIRRRASSGETARQISVGHVLSRSQIYYIITGRWWKEENRPNV